MKSQYTPRTFKEFTYSDANTSTIPAGTEYFFELDKRFEYDEVQITNLNSDNDAMITTNYSINQILPKGNSLNLSSKAVYDYIKIKNIGSTTIAINEIQILLTHTSKKGEMLGKLTSLIPLTNLFR